MIEENKKWLFSKGFSQEDVKYLIELREGYPIKKGDLTEQNQRIAEAASAIQTAVTKLKAARNQYSLHVDDLDQNFRSFTALKHDDTMNYCRTPKDSGGRKTIIEELETMHEALTINKSNYRVYHSPGEGFHARKDSHNQMHFIHKLGSAWASTGQRESFSDTSDYMSFLAIMLFDDLNKAGDVRRQISGWKKKGTTSLEPIHYENGKIVKTLNK
ncbi:hypothetical protein [Agarivorans sp. QJM3NY_33]|uniref:hypothetical protein n=1 Tax=Agarivorans sp. QJM3NY_33 TaxID=3421432 RepID=UPI003D7D68A2